MRGRPRPKVKRLRTPRRKISIDGKRRVVFPDFDNRVAVVITEGAEQSEVRWIDDETIAFFPNTWFRNRAERIKLRVSRVRVNKRKRVRLT